MITLSQKDAELAGLAPRKHKYGAKRTSIDGLKFDSQGEASRYAELKLQQDAGAIYGLEVHPCFPYFGKSGKQLFTIELDFSYHETGTQEFIVEDFKGKDTPVSRLKRILCEDQYGFKVRLIRK